MADLMPWYKRFPEREMAGEQHLLTNEEFGFFTRLRDYAWQNGGFPNDEIFLKRFAKTVQVSAYKLKKLWPIVENFFKEIDGKMYYEEDEEVRFREAGKSAKCKISGILGAKERWKQRNQEAVQMPLSSDGDRYRGPHPQKMANDGYPDPDRDPEILITEEPAAAIVEAAATAEPTGITTVLTETEQQAIGVRSMELHMQAPDRALALKLKNHYGLPVCDLIPLLVRFPDQNSPGLWLHKSIQDLGVERARQQITPDRKSPKQELQERSDQRVLENLQKMKKSAEA